MKTLFKIAEAYHVTIEYQQVPENLSISVQDEKDSAIFMDYSLLWKLSEERVHAAHELGHCITGSFYNPYSPYDVRKKHEHIADRWAIHKLVPLPSLLKAFEHGITEIWELAEVFDVTEDFMRKAVQLYKEVKEVL